MFKQLTAICFLALTASACVVSNHPTSPVVTCGLTQEQAQEQVKFCDTNYAEIVESDFGSIAYCMPNDVSEQCLDESGLDCDALGLDWPTCDTEQVKLFEACIVRNAKEACE